MSKTTANNATDGGVLKGKSHLKGGIKGIVAQTGQEIEVEGNEGVLAKETLQSEKTYTFDGKKMKPVEIASAINQLAGGVPIKETGGKITDKEAPVVFDVGQAIITKPAMLDKTLHDFNGEKLTKTQILSRINQDAGGNEIKLQDGGTLKQPCPNCKNKKEAYYKIRTKFAEQLAKLHANKLFKIADLQTGGLLLIYCQNEQKYKLLKITKIADSKIIAINLATKKELQIAFDIALQDDAIYFSDKIIMQSGGNVASKFDLSNIVKNSNNIEELQTILNKNKEQTIKVYHATSSKFDILNQGIKKTNSKNKKFNYSKSGKVYVSIYPTAARGYASFLYGNDIKVYEITVKLSELNKDAGALKQYKDSFPGIKNNLASSLKCCGLATINRDIYISEIKEYKIFDLGGTTSRFSKTRTIPRNRIKLAPRIFQGRQTKFSQKTVDKIVSEGYDKGANPIIVWHSNKENIFFVISGHSRWEASEILFKKGDKSLAQMPIKQFYGTKQDAIEYAVIESNRGGDPESLLSDVFAYKLAVKNGWNKERLLGYFAPDSRINKLRDLSFLNPKGKFFDYLGKTGETSFPYIERNARWVGIIRKSYPEKITNTHENEIFNFFWKPRKGNPQYAINKQRFFHLIEKRVATLTFDKTQPLNLENVKVSKQASQIEKQIEDIDKTLDWLFSEYTHNIEIRIRAYQQDNIDLATHKRKDNENILLSIEANIKKKIIFEKQIIEAEKTPTFDLFSQAEPTPDKKAITDKELIELSKEFKQKTITNKTSDTKIPPHIFVNKELYFDFGIKTKKRSFIEFTDILFRPYIKIDKQDYERILEFGESDFIVSYSKNKMTPNLFTFGSADGGWAIMPVDIKKITKKENDRLAEISYNIEDWDKQVKNNLGATI